MPTDVHHGESSTMSSVLASKRCAWVTPVLGVRGRLLYFGPILRGFSSHFADFRVITGEFSGDVGTAGFPIEVTGSFRRLYNDDRLVSSRRDAVARGVSIAGPGALQSLRREPVDLVVVNEFSLFSFYAALSGLLGPRSRVLWIVESRPTFRDSPTLAVIRKSFRRMTSLLADQFLTNNESGAEYLTQVLRVPPKKVLTRPYLVSDLGGPPAMVRSPLRNGKPVTLFYAGDLVKRKGLHQAIEALALLPTSVRSQVRFEIAGDGPDSAEIGKLIADRQLVGTVQLLGRVPYDEMRARYDGADIYLFPSLGDYRALSPFEAMSRGAAILGSKYDGGSVETVAEGKNGYRIDPLKPEILADRITQLVNQPEQLVEFSRNSLKMARRYTLSAAVDALCEASLRALIR